MERNGLMYADFSYRAIDNKSLGRAPSPFYSVKMKPVGQIGIDKTTVLRGDEMTFADYSGLGIVIGDYAGAIQFAEPQAGWTYEWNVSAGIFTVTDASAVSTQYAERYTWESLAITWAVLQSHNFVVIISAAVDRPAFLSGKRLDTKRNIEGQAFVWGQYDKYLLDAMKRFFLQMLKAKDGFTDFGVTDTQPGQKTDTYDGIYSEYANVLIALIKDLSTSRDYKNMLLSEHNTAGERQWLILKQRL